MYQTVFKRYEFKYLLTPQQKGTLCESMRRYMKPDEYGATTIRNIYYDTDCFLLARRSQEKPLYKEKLRLRSYRRVTPSDTVFVELKKKYDSVVYKRRAALSEQVAVNWLENGLPPPDTGQIIRELEAMRQRYPTLAPKVFLSYEREAFYALDGSDFRLTLDSNILARTDALSLCLDTGGFPLLHNHQTLMELKVSQGLPLWMVRLLSENGLYRTSFSKYGAAYQAITEQRSASYDNQSLQRVI